MDDSGVGGSRKRTTRQTRDHPPSPVRGAATRGRGGKGRPRGRTGAACVHGDVETTISASATSTTASVESLPPLVLLPTRSRSASGDGPGTSRRRSKSPDRPVCRRSMSRCRHAPSSTKHRRHTSTESSSPRARSRHPKEAHTQTSPCRSRTRSSRSSRVRDHRKTRRRKREDRDSSDSSCHCDSCSSKGSRPRKKSKDKTGTKPSRKRPSHSQSRDKPIAAASSHVQAPERKRKESPRRHSRSNHGSSSECDVPVCQCSKSKISLGAAQSRSACNPGPKEGPVIVLRPTGTGSLILQSASHVCLEPSTSRHEIPVNAKDLLAGVEILFDRKGGATKRCSKTGRRDQATEMSDDCQVIHPVEEIDKQDSRVDLLDVTEIQYESRHPPGASSCNVPDPVPTSFSFADQAEALLLEEALKATASRSKACGRTPSRSRSRSRSKKRSRNRPPDPESVPPELCPSQAAASDCRLRVCAEDCRSPWSPSITCPCLCHDPDRDVPWSSWPIFGPCIAAWVQDHRRKVVDRMRAEAARASHCGNR